MLGLELLLGEPEHEAGLPHTGVPDGDELEEIVVVGASVLHAEGYYVL